MDLYRLRQGLLNGEFRSIDLVSLYGERCQSLGRGLHLSAEESFNTAIKMAEDCDAEITKATIQGRADRLPLLFGIPISVNDLIS